MFFLILILVGFVSAEEYYVSNSGNDSWDGKSDATAWKTIGKVNRNVSNVGDDVYFKCGDEWVEERLLVDWDNATIGAYYAENGLVYTNLSADSIKPVFEGILPTRVNNNYSTNGFPSNWYAAIIQTVDGLNSVTIQDLKVINSAGFGISTSTGTTNVYRCDVFDTANSGINTYNAIGGTHRDNLLVRTARANGNDPVVSSTLRPAAYGLTKCRGLLFEKNIIKQSQGEAFNTNQYAQDLIIQNNIFTDVRAGCNIYSQSETIYTKNITVRRNLIYATNDSYYDVWCGGMCHGTGIYLNDYATLPAYDIYIYDNLLGGNLESGVRVANGDNLTEQSHDIYIFNNIFAGVKKGIAVESQADLSGNNEIRNNIFKDIQEEYCLINSISENDIIWSNNAFDDSPEDDCIGQGDVIGNVILSNSNWDSSKELAPEDFRPDRNSSTLNNGMNLGLEYGIDYFDKERVGNWDIGAIEFIEGEVEIPEDVVRVSDVFAEIEKWKGGLVSLSDVFVMIRAWSEGGCYDSGLYKTLKGHKYFLKYGDSG